VPVSEEPDTVLAGGCCLEVAPPIFWKLGVQYGIYGLLNLQSFLLSMMKPGSPVQE
jgi:hypothetical protein